MALATATLMRTRAAAETLVNWRLQANKSLPKDTNLSQGETAGMEGGRLQEKRTSKATEKILFVGWRRDMADVILSLDKTVPQGSELWLLNNVPVQDRVEKLRDMGNKGELKLVNLRIFNAFGKPSVRRDIKLVSALDEFGDPIGERLELLDFDDILVVSDMESGGDQFSCDGRSLATFLLVRDIRHQQANQRLLAARNSQSRKDVSRAKQLSKYLGNDDPIDITLEAVASGADKSEPALLDGFYKKEDGVVVEILDATNAAALLKMTSCNGYILSNRIVSNYMAQVVACPDRNRILSELLNMGGNQFAVRCVADYVDADNEGPLSFWDLSLRVRDHDEILLGYYAAESESTVAMVNNNRMSATICNPTNKAGKLKWSRHDLLMVIARAENQQRRTPLMPNFAPLTVKMGGFEADQRSA